MDGADAIDLIGMLDDYDKLQKVVDMLSRDTGLICPMIAEALPVTRADQLEDPGLEWPACTAHLE